ncbi:short-chain dehydrogenase [Catenovulum agarivorans]|uniref:short-chain dehydrogenase n=1 Tax=Catenovulum agarivorans TaxID=1172192 RepID=UPI00030B32A2|nr:short-chain dehydrogenase [Catenovulum agarivorans]
MSTVPKYPTPKEFLIDLPLYEKVTFQNEDLKEGRELFCFNETLDTYCPECNQHSIFSRIGNHVTTTDASIWVDRGRFSISLGCSRNRKHTLFFLFHADGQTIQKIGQLPSIASLNLFDVKKYSKVLEKRYFQELTKSIGLASHGVGVGSFVYLRRIFEFLIEEAHRNLINDEGWDESNYQTARMAEKIELLKAQLPDFLVENKSMYSILSKGIHELNENECLAAFPVVKLGIEIILDDKLEKMRREQKLAEAKKAIASLASRI